MISKCAHTPGFIQRYLPLLLFGKSEQNWFTPRTLADILFLYCIFQRVRQCNGHATKRDCTNVPMEMYYINMVQTTFVKIVCTGRCDEVDGYIGFREILVWSEPLINKRWWLMLLINTRLWNNTDNDGKDRRQTVVNNVNWLILILNMNFNKTIIISSLNC